jgi:membrane carboxypeptidase/penicillin-binding protein
LGGGEVKMVDLEKLNGAFANGGYSLEQNPILAIYDSKQNLIYENECALRGVGCQEKQVMSNATAYQMTNILSDNVARTPAFGANSVLTIPGQEIAVKTGTTNNLRDNWTIGYTSDRLVAVWVGNNNNAPMSYVASGITGASPIWHDIIGLTLNSEAPHAFAPPSSVVAVEMCARTDYLACGWCNKVMEYFREGTQPSKTCPVVQPVPLAYTGE